MKKNLFIHGSFYQVILASSLVLGKYSNCYNEIYIRKGLSSDSVYVENLKKIFDKVYIGDTTNYNDVYLHLREGNHYDNIFISDDFYVGIQYIINNYLSECGKVIYVEDGSQSYLEGFYYNPYKDLEEDEIIDLNDIKHIVNFKLEKPDIMGTYSKIDEREVLFKKFIRHELIDGRKNNEIKAEYIKKAIDRLYNHKQLLLGDDSGKKIIMCVDVSEVYIKANLYNLDDYTSMIENIISGISINNTEIYIKYHPRETVFYLDYLINEFEFIKKIDQHMPVEIFYKYKDLNIISYLSTALLSLKKIADLTSNSFSIINLINQDENIKNNVKITLDAFATIPQSIDDLVNALNK